MPQQPGGGGDQQEGPSQLGGPALRRVIGTGVALTCTRYEHAIPRRSVHKRKNFAKAILQGQGAYMCDYCTACTKMKEGDELSPSPDSCQR